MQQQSLVNIILLIKKKLRNRANILLIAIQLILFKKIKERNFKLKAIMRW